MSRHQILISWTGNSDSGRKDIEIAELVQLLDLPEYLALAARSQVPSQKQKGVEGEGLAETSNSG